MPDCCFSFLNRSLPISPKECTVLKLKEQGIIKVEGPFMDEISGLAIVKILDGVPHSTLMIKLKFVWNSATLDITNNGQDIIIMRPEEMLGILDLRSLEYCKIKHSILQQNLGMYYRFEKEDTIWEHFNKFINILKKEMEQGDGSKEKYPWLDHTDERKYMVDREMLEK